MKYKTRADLLQEIERLQRRIAKLEAKGGAPDITERKRKEEEASRMVTVVRDSNDAITIQDFEGKVLAWNRGAELMYGYSEEEALQKNIWLLTPPEREEEQKDFTRRLMAGEAITSLETQRKTKDGRILDVWMTVTKLVDDTGKPIGIASTERDITTRKRAEEALASTEQFLNNVIEQGPVSLWISDSEGTLIKMNQACRELFGVTDEEAVGKYNLFSDNLIEEQGFMPLVENVFEKGEIARFTIDYDLPRVEHIEVKEGTHRILDVVVSPIKDMLGKVTNALVQHNDMTDRKRAEKSLQESELKFREIVQYLEEGYYNCTADGRLQEHNREFNRILGFDLGQDLKGSLLPDFWQNPDDRKEYLAELVSRGFVRNFLIDAKTIRGEKLIVMANSHLVKDEKGTPVRIEGTFTDFTERKQAEENLRATNQQLAASNQQLRATEQQLRASNQQLGATEQQLLASNQQLEAGMERLAEAQAIAHLGSWEYDAVKDVISGSDEFHRLFGAGHDRLRTYQAFLGLLYPDDREHVGRDVQESLTKKALYDTEYRVRLPNGDSRHIHARGRVFADDAGKTVRMVGTCLDITGLKRTEEVLRKQTERLRNLHKTDQAILQAIESPEAIVHTILQHLHGLFQCERASAGIFDLEKKKVRVFAAEVNGEAIVKMEKDLAEEAYGDLEILRQGKMDIVEDLPRVMSPSAMARVLQAEGIRSYINAPLLSERGLIGVLNVGWGDPRAITPEDTEIAGEVAGQISIAIEQARLLQETKRHAADLEQRVRDRTAQLEETNKELDAFSYSVSHDLRAPLRAIDGFTRVLVDDYGPHLNTEGKRFCSIIHDNTIRMGRLIDDLLTFSRMGRAEMQLSRIDMGSMANSVFYELTTPESRERVDFQVGSLPAAVGDPSLMRQVWTNLLGNAVKFSSSRERAVINVSGELREGESLYVVQDNGAGFDMRYIDKLFGVFQRLHSTREFEGTGVGLALVQRVIRRHGGRVWAEGETDRGATFYFTLPRKGA